MHINTTCFGPIQVEADDILLFPNGVIGFEDCRHWILLADKDNEAVGWLQSIVRPDVALAVVSPRRFVPDYRIRVSRRELIALELAEVDQAYVLAVVSKSGGCLTLNLKAPLIINFDRRLGRQVLTLDEQPLQLELAGLPLPSRKSTDRAVAAGKKPTARRLSELGRPAIPMSCQERAMSWFAGVPPATAPPLGPQGIRAGGPTAGLVEMKEPTMLVLSRHRDESIMIGDNIVVTIVDIRGDKVRLGIDAPQDIPVHRQEVYEAIQRENRKASQLRSADTRDLGKPVPPNRQTDAKP